MISGIFFDFGETLVHCRPALETWMKTLNRLGCDVELSDLSRTLEEADVRYKKEIDRFLGRMAEFWDAYDRFVLVRLGIIDHDRQKRREVARVFREELCGTFPDTIEALDALSNQGLKLGIISNNTDDLLDYLNSLDLTEYFDSVTYSQEAGARKPDPRIFQVALTRLGLQPSEAAHVGDRYEQDVVGARAARLNPILLDRENLQREVDCLRITDLREIQRMI